MKSNSVPNEKNIVLIGFMGTGKTTVGQMLAEKLDRPFIDIDQEIENEYEMPTTEIFAEIGEKAFREKEKNKILYHCTRQGNVLSLGGGAFMQEAIRKACLSSSIVIHLDISFLAWKERLDLLIETRPVLQGKAIADIEKLFNERQQFYASHHLKMKTDGFSEVEVAEQIIESLQNGQFAGT